MTTIITNGTQIIADLRVTVTHRATGKATISDNAVKLVDATQVDLVFSAAAVDDAWGSTFKVCAIGTSGSAQATNLLVDAIMKLPSKSNVKDYLPALAELVDARGNGTIALFGEGAIAYINVTPLRTTGNVTFKSQIINPGTIAGIGSGSSFAIGLGHVGSKQPLRDIFIASAVMDPATSLAHVVWTIKDGSLFKSTHDVTPQKAETVFRKVLRSTAAIKTLPIKRKADPVRINSGEYY